MKNKERPVFVVHESPRRHVPVRPSSNPLGALEGAVTDALQRITDVADGLDEAEKRINAKIEQFGSILERFKGDLRR